MTASAVLQRRDVESQFDDRAQQRHAATLGMWTFIATEVVFFGVLFFGYAVARVHFPAAFAAASRHTDIVLGTLNTAVLLTSSFAMACAVRAAASRADRLAVVLLVATAVLGLCFAGIKLTEYAQDYRRHLVPVLDFAFPQADYRGALVFFWLYFATTGLHLVHLSVGLGLVLWLAWRFHRRSPRRTGQAEVVGLYWHFVDIVWIFLYPCLYLVSRT